MTGGGMTARTLDYLWLLVDASAWTLISALVTDICASMQRSIMARCKLMFAVNRREQHSGR
jgi:hypothetical protein